MSVDPDLTIAERTYAVSNVPLFLLQRPQTDAVPRSVASMRRLEALLHLGPLVKYWMHSEARCGKSLKRCTML